MLQTWFILDFSMIALLLLQATSCLAKPLDKTLDILGWKASVKKFFGVEQYYYGFLSERGAESLQGGGDDFDNFYLHKIEPYEGVLIFITLMLVLHFVIVKRRQANQDRNDSMTFGQWGIIVGVLECIKIWNPETTSFDKKRHFVNMVQFCVLIFPICKFSCDKIKNYGMDGNTTADPAARPSTMPAARTSTMPAARPSTMPAAR